LPRQSPPDKAQDAGNGYSLAKSCNAEWRALTRNPKGRCCFAAGLRYSSLIWNNQTALLAPCPAAKQPPSRRARLRQQNLRDWREVAGQLPRIIAALLFSRLWVPIGNSGRARISAFARQPLSAELQRLLDEEKQP